ncbi:secretin N-terminal domain-containing protein [Deinococcus multiflagellatus]|uniref:Secretin N-terminal domain-containing protein n=1 Tax=Deinococcus multiflagellatus TaxID=1656887 RepID=A0ABW1ZDS3_9DEIO|nr:secretin N-terminal domain-containing protein [Deinococcus multiflagellatus]MBZ9712748.1 secretin [Deinococcus multiflagellatus]
MTKRFASLLLTAALGMAAAQTAGPAAPVTAAADPSLSGANVTIEIGRYGGPLSSLLAALAKSAGYGLILDTNVDVLPGAGSTASPDTAGTAAGTPATGTAPSAAGTARPIVYSFQNKPFNEVWPLLMDVYGLSYDVVQLGGQPVLRVSNTPIQRTITLRNADATQAAQQVKLFFGTPTYSETPQRDAQGNTVGVTRTLVDVKLDSPTLRIVPDVRSNAVIVRGTNKEVAEVTRLLGQLDTSATTPATGTTPSADTQTVQRVYAVKGAQADITTLLAAQYPGLKVTAVGQTGQLVITGPQNQLEAALTLLGQVDRPAPSVTSAQITQRVFQLVNASAEEVKATLEGTLARDVTTNSTTPTTPAAGSTSTTSISVTSAPANSSSATSTATPGAQANTVTIIADKRTNTLIVRGTPDQVTQVAELIPQLDQRVPQINVQVRIQEITERAARSLGVNLRAGFGGFTVSTSGGTGLAASFDPTQSLIGFNLGATLNTLQTQGLSKSVYDGSITMQSGQRALGSSTETQNASSTAAATIKSGGRLEVNIPSQGNADNIQKQIDYGVNLDFFSPQVAPDGTITLRVRGQVNALQTAINATTLPNILQFTNSEAQTTLTFKNGETLLLSGLLANRESTTNGGVPFLSSIPVVGALFGNQNTTREQTQLLVVITGNIVR